MRQVAFLSEDSLEFVRTAIVEAEQFKIKNMHGESDFWAESYGRPYRVQNGTLVIPVTGVLLDRFSYAFGDWATGYEYIQKAIERGLEDNEVKRIALAIHSPGGMGAGLFELSDFIYESRSVKPIRSFAYHNAASAAYAIGSSAQNFYGSRSSLLGSIGVVIMHVNYEAALKGAGIEVTYIYAGKHKIDGSPYKELSDDAKEQLQNRVDKSYDIFVNTVARNREMDAKAVRETEARVFDSDEALALGFVDGIMALEHGLIEFQAEVEDENEMEPEALTQADVDKAVSAAVETAAETARTSERERLRAILSLDSAKANSDLALELATTTDLPPEKVEALLGKVKAAPAPKPEKENPFKAAMDADKHPEIEASEGDDKKDEPEELGSALLADYNKLSGSRVGVKQNG